MPARPGMPLRERNVIATRGESRMEASLGDTGDVLVVNENTRVSVGWALDSMGKERREVALPRGAVFINMKKLLADDRRLCVTTPSAIASIRGTGFEVSVDSGTGATEVRVIDGEVEVRDSKRGNPVAVRAAQKSRVEPLRPPSAPQRITREDIDRITRWIGTAQVKKMLDRIDPPARERLRSAVGNALEQSLLSAARGESAGQISRQAAKQIGKAAAAQSSKDIDRAREAARKAAESARLKQRQAQEAARKAAEAARKAALEKAAADSAKAKKAIDNVKSRFKIR
jgi:hypothetical protein